MSFLAPKIDSPAASPVSQARQSRYKEAEPLAWINGFARVAPQWITDRFNDHWSNGSQTGQAFCSVAGLLCHGPVSFIRCMIRTNDIQVNFDLARPTDPDDPNYYSMPFEFGGNDEQVGVTNKGRIYWGDEDQPADAWLRSMTGRNHPAYRGQCYVIYERIHCGQIQANSNARPALPHDEWALVRLPSPTIPAALQIPSTIDGDRYRGVNFVSALYDLFTHPRAGLGASSILDTDDWAAKAAALASGSKPAGGLSGGWARISPVHAGATEAEQLLGDYLSYIDGFLYPRNGKLRIDWFANDGTLPAELPTIAYDDLKESVRLKCGTLSDAPSKVLVTCLEGVSEDPDLSEVAETAVVPFVREINGGDTHTEKLERPWLTGRDAAQAYASRFAAGCTVPETSGQSVILPSCRRLDGGPLQPADLVRIVWPPLGISLVARITELMRNWDDGDIEIKWQRERGITPLPSTPAPTPRVPLVMAAPGAVCGDNWTAAAAPAGLSSTGGVVVFARRVENTVSSLKVWMDPDGTWGAGASVLGLQGFAARVALAAALDTSATTIDVTSSDPEVAATLGSGVTSSEQADDALVILMGDEWCSIGSVTSVAEATFRLNLLRGRLRSTAAAHGAGAIGWISPRELVRVWEHGLFIGGSTRHFKVQATNTAGDSDACDSKSVPIPDRGTEGAGTYRDLGPTIVDAVTGSIEFSTFTATATLIGYHEYTDAAAGIVASVPPKAYRKWVMSGSASGQTPFAGTCSEHVVTASGANEYDRVTGALSEGINIDNNGNTYQPSANWGAAACFAASHAAADAGALCTIVSTTKAKAKLTLADGGCGPTAEGCTSCEGEIVDILADEETDEDALTRAEASSGWSGWTAIATSSAFQQRVADFSVFRRRAKIRGSFSGAYPGYPYTATIQFEQRAYGSSDPFQDYNVIRISLTPDAAGAMELPETELPCLKGLEIRIKTLEVAAG